MTFPLNIAFRNMGHSDTIEKLIRDKAQKLERFSKNIITCRVVVELPHKRHQSGNLYHVTIDLSVKGREIFIGNEKNDAIEHKEIHAAIKDAFEAAERQLSDYQELLRGA